MPAHTAPFEAEPVWPGAGLGAEPWPEKIIDDLAWLAARICCTPMAFIQLSDGGGKYWFKSTVGLTSEQAAHGWGFCDQVIAYAALVSVRDIWQDTRLAREPLASGNAKIRSYAGLPLVSSKGKPIGVLSVADRVPRQLSPDQAYAMGILARQIVSALESRRSPATDWTIDPAWLHEF